MAVSEQPVPPTVALCPVGHQVVTPTLGVAPLLSAGPFLSMAAVLSFHYVITHLSATIRSFSLCVNVTYLYLEAGGKASGQAHPIDSFTSRG